MRINDEYGAPLFALTGYQLFLAWLYNYQEPQEWPPYWDLR